MGTVPAVVTRKPAKKVQSERHSIQLQFTTPEDVELYNILDSQAKGDRRPLQLFVLLRLHDLYAGQTATAIEPAE